MYFNLNTKFCIQNKVFMKKNTSFKIQKILYSKSKILYSKLSPVSTHTDDLLVASNTGIFLHEKPQAA